MDNTTISILICVILLLWIVITFNTIVSRFNRAQRAWGDVIAYERLKNDTLPQLAKLTEEYKEFESSLLNQVTELRTAIQSLDDNKIDTRQLAKVEQLSKSINEAVRVSVENYPDLKAHTVVKQYMKEIADKNTNVAAAITLFNRAVEEFNNAIQYFPNSLINQFLTKRKALDTFTDSQAESGIEFKPVFSNRDD